MGQLIQIGLFLLLGILSRRVRFLPVKTPYLLNQMALYIALPALILLKAPQLTLSKDTVVVAMFPWLMLLVSATLVLLIARKMKWSDSITGVLLMVIPLGNTGFMGVPIIRAFFGEAGIPYVIIYDQIGSLLILVSYCSLILARYGAGNHSVDLVSIIRRVLLFPPMIAFIAGLSFAGWPYPHFLTWGLELIAATLTPLVMLAIGCQLTLRLKRAILAPFITGLSIKLLIAPSIAVTICLLFGLDGLPYDVAIIESGMPPMITASALAVSAKMDTDLAVALAGLGLICALVTLPLLYFIAI